MATIRIKDTDRERIGFMKGLYSIQNFITILLDKHEQPELTKSEESTLEYMGRPPKVKTKLKGKPAHPSFAPLKEIYIEAWKKNNGLNYRWNGAIDATALNRLIKTLEGINEGDNSITDLFKVIMDRLPEFYKDKTINAINKNINGIISEIKSGGKGKGNNISSKYDWRT